MGRSMFRGFKTLVLGVVVCCSLPFVHASHGVENNDPLFPQELIGTMQIKAGLELVGYNIDQALPTEQRTVVCDASLKSIRSGNVLPKGIMLPVDYEINIYDYTTYGSKNLSLILGGGGSKTAIKLNNDSEAVILFPREFFNSATECHSYKIINAFGLISQQSPELVIVRFDDEQIENILSVSSFDFLAKDTHRRTWDIKNRIGFGDICIFNDAGCFNSIDYNIKLLTPLARDFVLWKFVYGTEGDAINLILKRVNNGTQTICRLFLYDTGHLSEVAVNNSIRIFLYSTDERPNEVGVPCMLTLGYLYTEICRSMLPKETLALWGVEYRRDSMVQTNEKQVVAMWGKLEPYILKIVNDEFIRLAVLFKGCIK